MKTKRYKAKIKNTNTGYTRLKNVELNNEQYIEMLKQVNKISSNGFKLIELYETY